MAQRQIIIRAGNMVTVVLYTVPHRFEGRHIRAAKTQCSTAARQKINMRHAWERLELLLAANFDASDSVVTLTYDDEHLPTNRAAAVANIKRFIRALRAARRKQGQSLKYIYITEGLHGDKRLHHHLVVNGMVDRATMARLWQHGTTCSTSLDCARGYEALARYLTKEPREAGSPNGKRCWTPSRGLLKPIRRSSLQRNDVTLSLPPMAQVIERESKHNQWGYFDYVKYMLPRSKPIDYARYFYQKYYDYDTNQSVMPFG